MTRKIPPKKLDPFYERAGGSARSGTAAYLKPKVSKSNVFYESGGQKTNNRGKQRFSRFETKPFKGKTRGQAQPRKKRGPDKRRGAQA